MARKPTGAGSNPVFQGLPLAFTHLYLLQRLLEYPMSVALFERMMKVAAYSGTRNLYPYMITSAKSLMLNSDVDKIYFLIEDNEIGGVSLPEKIECINVSGQTFFRKDGANMRSKFTYMALMRATYAKLFPQLDRILSLDVDTIVDGDVSDLWELPIDDCYYAASREPNRCHDGFLYTNIGVALYNLEKLRDGTVDRVINALNEKPYKFMEQDAFAEHCQGHIYDMPSEYNATAFTEPTDNPKIIHYAGIKNWFGQKEVKEYEKFTFDDVLKKSKNQKKRMVGTQYMIHACAERMWYVNDYLIPSMIEQGINREQIIVWEDTERVGNLESFVRSMEWIAQNRNYLEGTWHLQDDIVISKRFKELTDFHKRGIAAGFCNEVFDGGNVNMIGLVPVAYGWYSFPCIRIPNFYANEFADWYRNDVLPNNLHGDLVAEGKHDDALWNRFMAGAHQNEMCHNFIPNIVDHVDYLIGGSVVNKQRNGIRRAYRFEEPEIVEELKSRLL